MPTYTTLSTTAGDATTSTSDLTQLVDVVQEDISGSGTRRSYQVFVTGGIGPGVTSSLFQTVYDQDFSLQTANALFDMTIGFFENSSMVTNIKSGEDSNGKLLFPSTSMMMREKISNYKQYAQVLLGNSTASFYAPGVSTPSDLSSNPSQTGVEGDRIEQALFVNFRRLFARDELKKETFAMRLFQSAAFDNYDYATAPTAAVRKVGDYLTGSGGVFYNFVTSSWRTNLAVNSTSGSTIYADINSSTRQLKSDGGDVGYLVNTNNTTDYAGLIFYDQGIAVLDMGKVFMHDQHVSGAISAMRAGNTTLGAGAYKWLVRTGKTLLGNARFTSPDTYFIPDFVCNASIDDVVNHVSTTRFGSGSLTAATFQNVTKINSNIYFCRARSTEYNYSSNPTYTDTAGNINVINATTDERAFTYITTVGLYDSGGSLLAVAKLSRPIEKNDEKDLTLRVRLDF